MFVQIEDEMDNSIEGYKYTDMDGCTVYVKMFTGCVELSSSSGLQENIYTDDLPKLIKALQSAYTYVKGI